MKLYAKYVSIAIKSAMQYKMSFFFTVLGQILGAFSAFFGVYFLFARFQTVEGFAFREVLVCFSVCMTAFSIAECVARGFDAFPSMIGNGQFDRILVRPRNEMLQVLAGKFELSRIGRLLQAVIVLFFALPGSGIAWNFFKILLFFSMILSGVVIFSGLFIIYSAVCFFTLQGLEVMNIFTDGGREFGQYPFAVYGKEVLRFFTYVVPLALFQYYPLLFLTGKSDRMLYAFLPLVGMLFIIPCYFLWRFGLKHYKSTGS